MSHPVRELWHALRLTFQTIAKPVRRIWPARKEGKIPQAFNSPEEALHWYQTELNAIRLIRIAHMRSWQRQTKIFTGFQVFNVVIQLAIPTLLDSGIWGALNYVCALFVWGVQTLSIRRFVESRAGLLADLENDPDTEVWWYDAWTRKAMK